MPSSIKILFVASLIGILLLSDTSDAIAKNQSAGQSVSSGYSALKLFLEDEQHLTSIRRAKMVVSFSGISKKSTKLIDDIADTSEQAIEELEKLSTAKPSFLFEEFSDEAIAKATLDSLRITTAKEFLFEDDFEKDLLLSQLNVLRLISHLAKQIEAKETNSKRKAWLKKLADDYEKFYHRTSTRIAVVK